MTNVNRCELTEAVSKDQVRIVIASTVQAWPEARHICCIDSLSAHDPSSRMRKPIARARILAASGADPGAFRLWPRSPARFRRDSCSILRGTIARVFLPLRYAAQKCERFSDPNSSGHHSDRSDRPGLESTLQRCKSCRAGRRTNRRIFAPPYGRACTAMRAQILSGGQSSAM